MKTVLLRDNVGGEDESIQVGEERRQIREVLIRLRTGNVVHVPTTGKGRELVDMT